MMSAVEKAMYWIGIPACLLTLILCCSGCEVRIVTSDGRQRTEWLAATVPPSPAVAVASPYKGVPPVDLPVELRCANYAGGSCTHASLISLLRWQGLDEVADYWRRHYSGGAYVTDLAAIAEPWGLRYAYTTDGDAEFLAWCSRTRRGAAIYYYTNHSVTFAGYRDGEAVLLDNNRTGRLIRIPKETFLANWRSYGGGALTVVYSPSPPRPWI